MFKRIVLGTLLLGLIAVLTAGAVVRTTDRLGNVAEARGLGGGHGHGRDAGNGAEVQDPGLAGYERGGGYGGQGRIDAPGDGTGAGQAQVDEWLTQQGTVASVDGDLLVVQTSSDEITVENRPWWFAQEQGFSASVGDEVTLVGFYEGGDFEVGQLTNTSTGQAVSLRDETGRPMWAGRGRRGG